MAGLGCAVPFLDYRLFLYRIYICRRSGIYLENPFALLEVFICLNSPPPFASAYLRNHATFPESGEPSFDPNSGGTSSCNQPLAKLAYPTFPRYRSVYADCHQTDRAGATLHSFADGLLNHTSPGSIRSGTIHDCNSHCRHDIHFAFILLVS